MVISMTNRGGGYFQALKNRKYKSFFRALWCLVARGHELWAEYDINIPNKRLRVCPHCGYAFIENLDPDEWKNQIDLIHFHRWFNNARRSNN